MTPWPTSPSRSRSRPALASVCSCAPGRRESGRQLVTVAPQRIGRDGSWVLKHSGLALPPSVAREFALALPSMIATIEEEPHETEP